MTSSTSSSSTGNNNQNRKGENVTTKIKEDVGVVLKKVEQPQEQQAPQLQQQPDIDSLSINISKDSLLKGLSSSAELSRQFDAEISERDRIQTELTAAKGMAYTGSGEPGSTSSYWSPPTNAAASSAIYSLHKEPSSISGVLSKGSFESILLQEKQETQAPLLQREQEQEQEQQTVKYFYGMPSPITEHVLKQISKSLEPPVGFQDTADLMANHQVICPFCNRQVGWNRAVAREHIEGHEEFKAYRDRVRQTNQIWYETSAKLYRLREQQQYLQTQIIQTNKTLMMMSTAEDTGFIVEKLRAEQFSRGLNENVLPQDIRNNRLSLGDVPLTQAEKSWYESYVKEANLPEGIPFDLALQDLISRRKAAKYA
jgi:hypothetical protein